MSREGANNRIDSLKNSLNSDHYQRTALGSAVRFNTMLNVLDDFSNDENQRSFTKNEFAVRQESSINELLKEYDDAILDEKENKGVRYDTEDTIQQRLQNRAYKTALGQTVAKATTQRKGLYQDFNTSYSTGATGAFRSFTNGFVQDDEDYFGSRVLYDNVFGNYEDGTESLSNRRRLSMSDPLSDGRSVGEKVLDNVVNKSIYDQTEIIDRVDIEFGRFHGQSMVDQMSMTGSGLRSARQTIRTVMQEGSAYGRQVAARGESDDHPVTLAQTLLDRTNNDIDSTKSALNLLNNNLGNRSSTTTAEDGGYVNKAGVAEFIDLINTAGSRNANGSLTGGRISISSFQFQNETISAALSDKIQRHVLESVLQGGNAPLQIDLTLAYPRQRNLDSVQNQDGRYAVGQTNYGILGPNLIEAMKLQAVKEDVQNMLKGLGVSPDQIDNYVNLNIEFRDKKFHPKVYLTDNRASIGTQNLTAPVGTSVNQAGSNFETMRFVNNSFLNDQDLRRARGEFNPLDTTGNIQNNSVTQSLLYRQIVDSVNQEREYNNGSFLRTQGNTSTPILTNQQGSQVGFAGDIYQHLKSTLNFAHSTSFGWQSKEASKNSMHMFMILDQAFMLQLGSNSYSKQLAGEMGAEIGTPYSYENQQAIQYQKLQNNLFDLLIGDKASVVVDTKNYKEQVLKPINEKIYEKNKDGSYKNTQLISNFERHGKSLNTLVGFDLFKPSSANSQTQYDNDLSTMFSELRRLGFTKEAGFDNSDLKQIIGLASGNIQMAKAPRQHAKEFGLVRYGESGPQLISYYQGSSNMGLYSLGINSGEDGLYQKGDGDLTNTEMGIMLGRRDINKSLSRASSSVSMSQDFMTSNNILGQNIQLQEWILNSQEEEYELGLAQRHLSVTWNQLSQGTFIENPLNKQNIGKPLWQDNVNTGDLNILKQRLELLGQDLGLDSKAFSISERFGNVSGAGLTSINISIDLSKALSATGGFMAATVNLPKINFELSVLQGPQRGNGIFSDSPNDGNTPGFVYFVDKNKLVGNGLFVNESGQDISLLGRKRYEDDFISDIRLGGRIGVKSGQSAHMSSLDIVPQLFATLIGESISRFGAGASINTYNNLEVTERQNLLIDYVSNILIGHTGQIDESVDRGSNVKSSLSQIKENLNLITLQDLNETINRQARSKENEADSILLQNRNIMEQRKERTDLSSSLVNFNNKWFHKLKEGKAITDNDVFDYISDLNSLAEKSPQLTNMIMKTSYQDKNASSKLQSFKEFQTLLFGSFLQNRDDKSYAGQQGFYRTTLMGVGANDVDKNTASLMFDLDQNPSLLNNKAYARFKPLEYNPLTNIHDVLYRSIASKSTSMGKNDSNLDSVLFESEARDLGDAANLRLMSSIGIGNIRHRDDYIIKNEFGALEIGKDQDSIFKAMGQVLEASSSDMEALNNARQAYLNNMSKEFGDLDSEDRKDTIRLSFYTGPAKKLSQLPQRIKNAMGSRPMYQYSVEAQMALERGESLNDLSSQYLERYRDPLLQASKNKVKRLLEKREVLLKSNSVDSEVVKNIDAQIDDLKVIGGKAFNGTTDGLGAIFSGRIKSVLNQEQISFITKTRERLENSIGDLIKQGELADDTLDELLRVEVMKAGFTNRGLGKMIAGSNHMNYSIALIQLSGTYNDTFSANPLYGTTYKSEESYRNLRTNNIDIYNTNLSALDRDDLGVYNLGMKEGQFETKRQSIKGSKMGSGGMNVQIESDDIVVQDKSTGLFVHKRKVNGKWVILNHADSKRNLSIISNVIDNNGFSPVGSPSLASQTQTIYGREGQNSINYIYSVDSREGNFANNEYLLDYSTLTSVDPSSGQRVEGTDASSLIKGVAMFAGRVKYNSLSNNQLVTQEMNVFENLEDQIVRSYERGELEGSLKSYLDKKDVTQKVTLQDGRVGYAPLSSSIHGVYNANNFKSFFWSHGATLLKSKDDKGNRFMLDNLFDNSTESQSKANAKKLVGSLLLNFGTSYIQEQEGSSITTLKRTLMQDLIKGDFGSHYQKLALTHAQSLGDTVESIFNNKDKRADRSKDEIVQDLLFNKISRESGFSNTSLGALNILTSSQLQKVLDGDRNASNEILNIVRKGILDPVSNRAVKVGGINFTNSADTQAALISTAVDFMHQLSSQGSKMTLPSDVDFDNSKVREVLLNVIGIGHNKDEQLTQDIMDFLSGVNSNVTTLSVFADITFAYGKDPTGTQSIGKHESQHLIAPFLGDIQKYQEGGKLSNLQHTVASLAALVTKTSSGLVFYDQMAKVGFNDKEAINLVSQDSDYLFSTFNKQNFLGFYQMGLPKKEITNYVEEYKNINKALIKGQYDWDAIQTVRDANDRTKFHNNDPSFQEDSKVGEAYKQVERYINKFHSNSNDIEKSRLFDKYIGMGGDRFAIHQLEELTNMMIIENDKYQADPSKRMGMDSASQFLENMDNKQIFFSIPDIDFEMQNGEIVAKPSNRLLSTVLPSADDMRVLGGEYSGFVDPVINHYKILSQIFVPGTLTNSVFEKIRLSARDNRAIILSTEEYKAFEAVTNAANAMPVKLQKSIAGARTQEAFAGKNKYEGFTATGIGNLLMPFGSVVASQTKLDAAGLKDNSNRFEAIQKSNEKISEFETILADKSLEGFVYRPKNLTDSQRQNLALLRFNARETILDDPWAEVFATREQKQNAKNLRIESREDIIDDPWAIKAPITSTQRGAVDNLRNYYAYENTQDPWFDRTDLQNRNKLNLQNSLDADDFWSQKPKIYKASKKSFTPPIKNTQVFLPAPIAEDLTYTANLYELHKKILAENLDDPWSQIKVGPRAKKLKTAPVFKSLLLLPGTTEPYIYKGIASQLVVKPKLLSNAEIRNTLKNISSPGILNQFADYLESNIDNYSEKNRPYIQTILDEKIPQKFTRLNNKPNLKSKGSAEVSTQLDRTIVSESITKAFDLNSTIDFLMDAVLGKGVIIKSLGSDVPEGALGAYIPKFNTIALSDNLSSLDRAGTLLHELIHVYQTQDEIPLMGLKSMSDYANPTIHRSKSSDLNLNLKEWQAHSIEQQFRDLIESDGEEQAFNYVKALVDSLNSKNIESIKTTFENLGLVNTLNSNNKKFTVNKSKNNIGADQETLYTKSDKLKINDSLKISTTNYIDSNQYNITFDKSKNLDNTYKVSLELVSNLTGEKVDINDGNFLEFVRNTTEYFKEDGRKFLFNTEDIKVLKSNQIKNDSSDLKIFSKGLYDTVIISSTIEGEKAELQAMKSTSIDKINSNDYSYSMEINETFDKDASVKNKLALTKWIRQGTNLLGVNNNLSVNAYQGDGNQEYRRKMFKKAGFTQDVNDDYHLVYTTDSEVISKLQTKVIEEGSEDEEFLKLMGAYDTETGEVFYNIKPSFEDNLSISNLGVPAEVLNDLRSDTPQSINLEQSNNESGFKSLNTNILNFYRRQRSAEAFGISNALQKDFNTMKLEAIETKNQILDFAKVEGLNVEDKKAAFENLKAGIKQKRDIAYNMARIDVETGASISNKSESYSEKILTEEDRYIYHAQALNYDALLTSAMLIGHEAEIEPLSKEIVKHLEKSRDKFSQIEFLLNSFEDKGGVATFAMLGHKQSEISQDALFSGRAVDPEEGMVGRHMKAVKQIGRSFKGLGIPEDARNAKLQYALQQIESSIEMYKKRSEDMQAFNAERESYSMKKNEDGKDIVDPAVQRKIDAASTAYNTNTRDIISFLETQKSRLLNNTNYTDQDIRNVFEDIDVKIAANDKANIYMAEVFRSPPPGGTDPRMHMYQLMQGIQSLNVVSQMLSDTRQTGTQPKMMYSTERGQTATVLAALGVTTLGGGDFDGDPYTTIFSQMGPTQKAIQTHNSNVSKHTVTLNNLNRRKLEMESRLKSLPKETEEDLNRIEDLDSKIDEIDERIEKAQQRLQNDTAALNEAKQTLEQQINVGHNNFTARARKQVANYMGIDESFFVAKGEVMIDAYGNAMVDEDGNPRTGINMDKTYDADALAVFGEKGYDLMEGIASSSKNVITIMNNMDVLLGNRSTPEAFNNGEFLNNLVKGIVTVEGKISNESPAIGMLKDRVTQLQNNTQSLTPEQKMFVSSLKDAPDEQYKAYLQQFDTLHKEMETEAALHSLKNQQLSEEARKDFNKRAFINQWIGGNLYSSITSDATLGKFMAQGNGMTLTEGTFDMTLKTLGKAGGEVLGKTYNTIIGTTFQDAPVITYGRQMLEEGSDLAEATKSEFARQLEGDSEYMSKVRQELIEEGINSNDPKFKEMVKQRIQDQSLNKFEEYQETTRKAVLKSEGVQAFTKNVHQLLRDSIKLKDGDGDLINTLKTASENYDKLSKQIAANDAGDADSSKRTELINARDQIISGMASKLGPGPGLKSLIDLDYLTNESDALGLSKNDFEQRFLTNGGIDSNRQMLIEYSNSMGANLTEQERAQLQNPDLIQEESSALLKVARNMTAKNLSNMVTSFRMGQSAIEGRGEQIKNFANSHKASLATKPEIHSVQRVQTLKSRTEDGLIDVEDEAGKYIQSKYGIIELEGSAGAFDANRQHKNALGIHLGVEESHMYNEDGSVSDAYRTKLKNASSKLGISNEEYTLMFDIHHEESREQISGLFGDDGEKMAQFTVMNMMRKDIARAMMDGRAPSAKNSTVINENIGSEALTTLAQLAASGKLEGQGMDIFSGMYKGVVGNLLELTDSVVEYRNKGETEIRTMQFSHMSQQQKSAYMTKLIYQNMVGTEVHSSSGFNRNTSEESKDWKTFNANLIANSVLELDENGRMSNDFIDALDKAGSNSSTGQQVRAYAALGEEYLKSALDNDVQREALLQQYLPNKGELGTKESTFYREQMDRKVRSQMKYRQEQDSKKYASARSRHNAGRGMLQRSSFMNKINTSAIDQLSTDTSANALDLFVPLALTMVGSAISEGSVDKDQVMQLGGATFTAFQYARTGTIDSTNLDPTKYKKRLASAQAMGGIFKFKNALAQHGDENVGMAVAQLAVQEATAVTFNAIATPWLSNQIAEKGLGVKHAPAMNALDMKKYQASHQLAGNLGASVISAVSSTLISGLLMRGVESMSQNLGDTIQSFLPAANAVNAVNEAISKRRQQEAAFADFAAETDDNEQEVKDYMVLTNSSYDSNNYAHLAELNEPQDITPSMDGSLTVDLLV